jgi:hypothetical protein
MYLEIKSTNSSDPLECCTEEWVNFEWLWVPWWTKIVPSRKRNKEDSIPHWRRAIVSPQMANLCRSCLWRSTALAAGASCREQALLWHSITPKHCHRNSWPASQAIARRDSRFSTVSNTQLVASWFVSRSSWGETKDRIRPSGQKSHEKATCGIDWGTDSWDGAEVILDQF